MWPFDWFGGGTPQQLTLINQKLEVIMAQIDDLKTALTAIGDGVDDVDTKLDGVRDSIAAVDTEVKALIALLGTAPVDLTEALAQAQAISAHVGAVQGEVQVASDSLKAIPPAPTV